jgi:hypothetical protein
MTTEHQEQSIAFLCIFTLILWAWVAAAVYLSLWWGAWGNGKE